MGRERRDFIRRSGFRDAKLVVIATEGEKTEKKYFQTLTSSPYFPNPRVHVEVIPSFEGKSDPRAVIKSLDAFKKEYRIREDDELWLVIDRDFKSWKKANLASCISLCKQKKYTLAISNPSFEIWVMLHLFCVASLPFKEKEKIRANKKTGSRTHCEKLIIEKIGTYKKSNPDFSQVVRQVKDAIARAKLLDTENLMDNIGSDAYKLVQGII